MDGKQIKQRKLLNDFYTLGEEIFSSISHGLGALLAIAGLVIAAVYAALYGNAYAIVSASIYGATMVLMYLASTLYHSLHHKSAKKVFRIFDHCSISLLIAGTYTPYTLVTLKGPLGWTIFGIVWGISILSIVFNAVSIEKFKVFTMISYLLTGWTILIVVRPLMQKLHKTGLILLFLGGIMYTLGVIFYKFKKPYFHPIWHIFVISGSVLHYFSILFYVLPTKLLG